ncbi:hypothetical protein FHS43_002383 [Streptosporangium becharense]|uniref:Uncharacterized protein n=1 Tax=Streptosporangium becharense TaxID=1816182 RepID=A0A7W9IJD4_9ACTN|nr:hypothetical protein [Streptosporangium becharense]MBB2911118.1 hypothetical protein [Streptosporangium becharense]MBB5821824.1 hypothetical protein [Streptosporangium becharense]
MTNPEKYGGELSTGARPGRAPAIRPITVSAATSKPTTSRCVTPAGMSSLVSSTPSIRTAYGRTTRTSTPSAARLSSRTGRA